MLNNEEIKAVINKITRKNFGTRIHSKYKSENISEFQKKHDIAFSNDYLSLISNMKYQSTSNELKSGQNKYHKQTNLWHNYNKLIIVNQIIYKVKLNLREDKGRFYIHNVKLKEVDVPVIGLTRDSAINSGRLSPLKSIIPNNIKDLQKNLEIPMEWIDENTLKLEIVDPINKLTTIAVCKTIKKSMEFYLTDGQQVESIKEKDLDAQLLHQFYEKVEEITGLQKNQCQEGMQR